MNITTDELFMIIGEKTAEIRVLQSQNNVLKRRIAELEDALKKPAKKEKDA